MAGQLRSGSVGYTAVLDSLYEAALQPELMSQALHVYARAFNGTSGNLIGIADHQGRLIISRDGRDGAEAYAAGWWKHDFVTERGEARKVRGIVTDLDLSTEEERASHPFYQEFARPYDAFWLCAKVVRRAGAAPFAVTIRRGFKFGPFLPREIERLAPLARHAARAFDLAVKLSDAASQSSALCEALTHLGYGVIGLGDTGRVLFANAAADRLSGDGLRIGNGAILAATPQGQRSLDLLISETLALTAGRSSAPPRPLALRRPSGRVPAVIYGIPVPARQMDLLTLLGGRPKALLVVIEPDAARQLDESLLQEMFALSPGEARVAVAIATGAPTKQAAERLGIAEGTIRFVLKRIFQKLGVSRQAELVLLLAPLLRHTD